MAQRPKNKKLEPVEFPLTQSAFAVYIPLLGSSVVRIQQTPNSTPSSRHFVNFFEFEFPQPSREVNVSKKTGITRYQNTAFKFREFNEQDIINTLAFRFLPTAYTAPKQERTSTYTKTWEEGQPLVEGEKAEVRPYWVINAFNEALRQAINAFSGTDAVRQRRGVRSDVFDILYNAESLRLLESMGAEALGFSNSLISRLLSTISMYLAEVRRGPVREQPFRGANIFSTAYDKVLMSFVYKDNLNENHQMRLVLSAFRALCLECDVALESALMTMTKGLWASVRLTDNGIPATPIDVTFIDLFAGVGSFRKAFESAGARCVWTNDIIPTSMTSYSENFDVEEGELLAGDIRSVLPRHIKALNPSGELKESLKYIPDTEIDFVLGGFPCKSFSAMGQLVRRSTSDTPAEYYSKLFLNDARYGRLIFDTLDVISQVKAKGFMFENVPQFISMWVPVAIVDPKVYLDLYGIHVDLANQTMRLTTDLESEDIDAPKVKTMCVNLFEAVIVPAFNALRSEGYGFDISWQVSDARHYGAQSRERVFIIGIRKDLNMGEFDFSKVPFVTEKYKPSFQETMCHIRSEQAEPPYTLPFGKGSIVNPKYNVSYSYWGIMKEKIWRLKASSPDFETFVPPKNNRFGKGAYGKECLPEDISELRSLSEVERERLKYYGTLLATNIDENKFVYYDSVVKQGMPVYRSITPRESARLMTFDPDRVTRMPNPTTDYRFYQQCGFSIVTRHVKEIVLLLCSQFDKAKQNKKGLN